MDFKIRFLSLNELFVIVHESKSSRKLNEETIKCKIMCKGEIGTGFEAIKK